MYEKKFELRYFEMNKHGEASPTTILTLLEETASDHCSLIGHSLYDLIKQHIGWVLISGVMKIYRNPKHKENITIKTWLSSYTLIKGIRENVIFDEQGNIIGRAKGLWVFFDVNRRRPVQIFDDIKEKWSSNLEESLEYNMNTKINILDTAKYISEFPIHRLDIDMNQHVNNIKYLHWVLETIPDQIMDNCYLHSIEGRFINEANFGDTIISLTNPDQNSNCFEHTIKVKESNQVCATARTIWMARNN